jgi:hypothetical protein
MTNYLLYRLENTSILFLMLRCLNHDTEINETKTENEDTLLIGKALHVGPMRHI